MTEDQLAEAEALYARTKGAAEVTRRLIDAAKERNYFERNNEVVCQSYAAQLRKLMDEQDELKAELTRQRESQKEPITDTSDYWKRIATSAMERNDKLISQLREKEKIAAEWERIHDELRAACHRFQELAEDARDGQNAVQAKLDEATATVTEWEQKFFALAQEHDMLEGVLKRESEERDKAVAELNALKEKTAAQGAPVDGKPENMRFFFDGATGPYPISRTEFELLVREAKRARASFMIVQERDNERRFKYA